MLDTLRKWRFARGLSAMAFILPTGEMLAPKPRPLPAEIRVPLIADVQSRLLRHYETAGTGDSVQRVDFRLLNHAFDRDGKIQARGEFLLSEKTGVMHMGRVDLFYAEGDSGWRVVKDYRLEEKAVRLHRLAVQVKDGISGAPLPGATVVVRRGLHPSDTGRTNPQGTVQLHVLGGTFQLFVTHPQYHSGISSKIEVRAAHRADDILLVPIGPPFDNPTQAQGN